MPEIGDVYRGIVKGRILGSVETRNMFTYGLSSANATETEVAVGIESALEDTMDSMAGHLCNAWSMYECEVQKWHPQVLQTPGYWLGYHTHGHSVTGESVSDLAGYQPAIFFLLKTGFKKTVGRKFFAGVAEEYTTAGAFSATMLAALASDLAALLLPVTFGAGGAADPGVLDKNGIFRPFTSGVVGSIISSMRRRKPGYGI